MASGDAHPDLRQRKPEAEGGMSVGKTVTASESAENLDDRLLTEEK